MFPSQIISRHNELGINFRIKKFVEAFVVTFLIGDLFIKKYLKTYIQMQKIADQTFYHN